MFQKRPTLMLRTNQTIFFKSEPFNNPIVKVEMKLKIATVMRPEHSRRMLKPERVPSISLTYIRERGVV